ncbi:S8 family serine peptidase [Arthrobacter sp. I2-34]|uniref:S8 family serine peptidase n=1 Tax=Arthrobacter hankyongi TaxID=2904801 RepID=A0ABS9L6X3_9MICC|nr:S8 family serine peptidase [Arthrobacter hankyongi]MCG2622371.1 S8 family serine peptidase [Arthrobacter hankyongi]
MIEPDLPASAGIPPEAGSPAGRGAAVTTGRYIVVFAEDGYEPASVLGSAGLSNVASSRDFQDRAVDITDASGADATVFETLGIAVVSASQEQLSALQGTGGPHPVVLSVSPELVHHVLGPAEYVRGYRDGVADLSARLDGGAAAAAAAPAFEDSNQSTWGLQATRAVQSAVSGHGVKVAILDTGFDAAHPDFAGRSITTQSFVQGESAQDGHGHGTHCTGTACGPRLPSTGPRYGIAYGADIFAGKVLSNAGSGTDAAILAGIDWAVANGCAVVSMSFGANLAQAHPPYTAAGQRALDRGVLLIAAAGNNAQRPQGNFGFVGVPANSPYIMAVGALDQQLAVPYFSARSLPGRGGQVDVAGPGWQVYSSWPMPGRYRSISGTSMAAPHAAGVAALWAEATGFRGRELWSVLAQESDRLLAASADVGSGLVIAPQ